MVFEYLEVEELFRDLVRINYNIYQYVIRTQTFHTYGSYIMLLYVIQVEEVLNAAVDMLPIGLTFSMVGISIHTDQGVD